MDRRMLKRGRANSSITCKTKDLGVDKDIEFGEGCLSQNHQHPLGEQKRECSLPKVANSVHLTTVLVPGARQPLEGGICSEQMLAELVGCKLKK